MFVTSVIVHMLAFLLRTRTNISLGAQRLCWVNLCQRPIIAMCNHLISICNGQYGHGGSGRWPHVLHCSCLKNTKNKIQIKRVTYQRFPPKKDLRQKNWQKDGGSHVQKIGIRGGGWGLWAWTYMHIVGMHGHGNISLHWIGLGVTWDINSHALVQHIGIAHIQASSTICGYVFLCTIFF